MEISQFTANLLVSSDHQASQLLQILGKIQQQYTFIPQQAIKQLSESLLLTEANILAVISFYSFLHCKPPTVFDLRVSNNITDQMRGSIELTKILCDKLRVQLKKPRTDRRVTVNTTSCIGMSDQGPALLVNGQPIVALDRNRISSICQLIESNTPIKQWPTEFFRIKNNIQRADILLTDRFKNGSAVQLLLEQGSQKLLRQIELSNLRGRGGAGFNTGLKWRMCQQSIAEKRYVVCNADEGEPGTFKDRVLLTTQADKLIEGMTLCAGVISTNIEQQTKGIIYLRGEYRYLHASLEQVLQNRRDVGLLGKNILGKKGFDFDIDIHLGAGAYICGEESALIESLEGKRGIPRNRPPFPVTQGYKNQPTVVNNVETFINTTLIAIHGADWYKAIGTEQSTGSKLLSISGDCLTPGIYEYPFGTSIKQILSDCGASNTQAVQVSGPSGFTVSKKDFDRCISFEDIPSGGSIMIFNQQRELLDIVKNFIDFFVDESCGFCTPCRVGSPLLKQLIGKVHKGLASNYDLVDIKKICLSMSQTSQCGLGKSVPNCITGTLEYFPQIYQRRLKSKDNEPVFELDTELQQAHQLIERKDSKLTTDFQS